MTEGIVIVFALAGTFFLAVGSIGIWRLPDLYCRMHAQTKGSTLGLVGILIAASVFFMQTDVAVKAALTILFQFLTAPTGAHLISRSAHRCQVALWDRTLQDDLSTSEKP